MTIIIKQVLTDITEMVYSTNCKERIKNIFIHFIPSKARRTSLPRLRETEKSLLTRGNNKENRVQGDRRW